MFFSNLYNLSFYKVVNSTEMDYKIFLQQIKQEKPIPQKIVKSICKKVQQLLIQQSNLQPIQAPINIVGDIHGQFYDLLKLLKIGGQPPEKRYVFVGDFVDRGYHSLETILYLFCLKIMYPDSIYLLRGNHQSRQISCMYGFHEQINRKYGNTNVWKYCNDTFDYLPISGLIAGQIFCVHGGLSPDIHAIDQIRQINRKVQIPQQGPFADLMWSDPQDIESWAQGHRGAGWLFGHKVVTEFNHHNGLKLIARAHQLAQQGYVQWFQNKNLFTVWSAPNYCYRCGNMASFLQVDEHTNYKPIIFGPDQKSKDSQHYRTIIPYFL